MSQIMSHGPAGVHAANVSGTRCYHFATQLGSTGTDRARQIGIAGGAEPYGAGRSDPLRDEATRRKPNFKTGAFNRSATHPVLQA